MSRAGDVTPEQAWELLAADPDAVLVDVRTRAEWALVGMPDLSALGKRVLPLEWVGLDGRPNDGFVAQLAAAGVPTEAPVAFLCRSAHRSVDAAEAAADAGYARAVNVLDGFEGPVGPQGHRDVAGWKVAGLPWRQS